MRDFQCLKCKIISRESSSCGKRTRVNCTSAIRALAIQIQKAKINCLECLDANTGVLGFAWGVTYLEYLYWHVANILTQYPLLKINCYPAPVLGHHPILVFIFIHSGCCCWESAVLSSPLGLLTGCWAADS